MTTVQNRLDFWPGLFILFSIAFGPTFIALNIQVNYIEKEQLSDMTYVNSIVLGIICFFWILNTLSIMMLNHCYRHKRLGSFQEMAWSTSQGNRGYIFLISAMKIAYLCVTSAYCISFIACYLTSLLQYFSKSLIEGANQTSVDWGFYGAYVFFVLALSAAALLATRGTEPNLIYETRCAPKTFFIASVISFAFMVLGLVLIAVSPKVQYWMIGTAADDGKNQTRC